MRIVKKVFVNHGTAGVADFFSFPRKKNPDIKISWLELFGETYSLTMDNDERERERETERKKEGDSASDG